MPAPVVGLRWRCSVSVDGWLDFWPPYGRRSAPRVESRRWDIVDGSLWHGWSVQTHSGDRVGSVRGHFDTGPYAGHLRVHQARTEGTAVFAIPVSAVATSGNGMIVLTHSAPSALVDWLAYVIRRRGTVRHHSPVRRRWVAISSSVRTALPCRTWTRWRRACGRGRAMLARVVRR